MPVDLIFETAGLRHRYRKGGAESIKDVSIRVARGRKTALLGANGAGKSTLFHHFNGVLKPAAGSVMYDGEPISYVRDGLRKLRSDVAVVLQNPDDQIFSATVEEDVAFGLLNMGASREEADERIDEALFAVGLSDCRMKPMQQLSYGQRKRVAFAGALATRPKALILDEPTAGLDPQMAQEVMEIADQLHHGGTDVIISTHDVDLAYAWAEEMHVLRGGGLVYSGDPEGFYSDPVQVSMSGLMPPSMFAINSNLCMIRGERPDPYPRTRGQLLAKMSPRDVGTGTIFTLSIADRLDEGAIDRVSDEAGQGAARGIFGMGTRKLAFQAGLRLDYVFNSIDNCVVEALLGNNAVILHDASMRDLVLRRVSGTARFGAAIRTEAH